MDFHSVSQTVGANNYRARKAGAIGHLYPHEWIALCQAHNYNCAMCGKHCPDDITIDHIIPFVRGGTNMIDNIQPLCRPCNNSKRSRETAARQRAWDAEIMAVRHLLCTRHNLSIHEAFPSLLSGELATVLLPQENPGRLIEWLEQQAKSLDATEYWLSQDVAALAAQLRAARERQTQQED